MVLDEGGTYGGGVADVQPVYNFLGDTYNFYNSRWARDSVNDAGMALKATVRWCDNTTIPTPPNPPPPTIFQCPLPNAYWNAVLLGDRSSDVHRHRASALTTSWATS